MASKTAIKKGKAMTMSKRRCKSIATNKTNEHKWSLIYVSLFYLIELTNNHECKRK